MNNRNLISLGDRPEEERRRIASMGGKASGAARRAKRDAIRQEIVVLAAKRKMNTSEIVALQRLAKELRRTKETMSGRALRSVPLMPRMSGMKSRIPDWFWDE